MFINTDQIVYYDLLSRKCENRKKSESNSKMCWETMNLPQTFELNRTLMEFIVEKLCVESYSIWMNFNRKRSDMCFLFYFLSSKCDFSHVSFSFDVKKCIFLILIILISVIHFFYIPPPRKPLSLKHPRPGRVEDQA